MAVRLRMDAENDVVIHMQAGAPPLVRRNVQTTVIPMNMDEAAELAHEVLRFFSDGYRTDQLWLVVEDERVRIEV